MLKFSDFIDQGVKRKRGEKKGQYNPIPVELTRFYRTLLIRGKASLKSIC